MTPLCLANDTRSLAHLCAFVWGRRKNQAPDTQRSLYVPLSNTERRRREEERMRETDRAQEHTCVCVCVLCTYPLVFWTHLSHEHSDVVRVPHPGVAGEILEHHHGFVEACDGPHHSTGAPGRAERRRVMVQGELPGNALLGAPSAQTLCSTSGGYKRDTSSNSGINSILFLSSSLKGLP